MITVAETHYDILGVLPAADPDVLKGAYRALIRKYHPDVAGAAGAEMTGKVNHAYDVLSDEALRSAYDRGLREEAEEAQPQYQPPAPHNDGWAPDEPASDGWTDEYVYAEPAAPQLTWSPRRQRFAAVATLVSATLLIAASANLMIRFTEPLDDAVGWKFFFPLFVGLSLIVTLKKRFIPWLLVPYIFPTLGFLAGAALGWWGFSHAYEAIGPLTSTALALLLPAAVGLRFATPWLWRLWRSRPAKK